MESVVDGNGGSGGLVVMELSHIKELVRQLEVHLGGAQTQEVCKHLASQISSLTERSITLVTSSALVAGARKRSAAAHSPLVSDASDAPFKPTKKRKTAEKVKLQVKVSSAAAGDAPADDGHSWRKYGQKEILGAKHPRAYYRCTHRHSQGCAATKQVQRTDEDAAVFDVVYIGDHTCVQRPAAAAGKPEQKENPDAHGLLQSLSSNLTVKTEGLAVAPPEEPQQQGWIATTPAFCLSSTPAASGCLAPSTSDNWGVVVSPATSDSDLAASFPPLDTAAAAAGDARFGEVMSALVDIPDDFADFDISSFFV